MTGDRGVLYIVVCGAGPAAQVGELATSAQRAGWDVHLIATPAALAFIDTVALAATTGHPVRTGHRTDRTGQPRLPRADAIIVAPASYNTINKWATGIADTYHLDILAEAPAFDIPIVVLPFVNTALATRPPFLTSVQRLRDQGIHILLGPDGFVPHPPGTGTGRAFPWNAALNAIPDA